MSQLYSQGEPPKDANSWLWWLIFVVGGGLVSAVVSLAKMIKTADTTRIESLEKTVKTLEGKSTEYAEERIATLEARVEELQEKSDRCEEERDDFRERIRELEVHTGSCPKPKNATED